MTDAVSARPSGLRLAVLGSPISHSKSAVLHAAAYEVLGLDWRFEAIEVGEGEFAGFLDTVDDSWRGLAVTMPLKREVMGFLDEIDTVAQRAGAVNTVLFDHGRRFGFNTDVYGLTRAITQLGVAEPRRVLLLGAGATAASVTVAVAAMGATALHIVARSPDRAAGTASLAESLGLEVTVSGFEGVNDAPADVVVSTLPGGTRLGRPTLDAIAPSSLRATTPLLDVAYGAEPSELVRAWVESGGSAADGLGMLLHQAVQQVRVFVGGGLGAALDEEPAIVEAMKAALEGHSHEPTPRYVGGC
ncbi:MAG: shikimate dehydrogenase [Cryobacterium sp.]|nr:shikimate dehydrogenase [Cryobacterium sp.]